jgi:hypothetical protein
MTDKELDDLMADDEEEEGESGTKPSWIEEQKEIVTGRFLTIKSGFLYTILLTDALLSKGPTKVRKDFNNDKDFKPKYDWEVFLQKLTPFKITKENYEQEDDLKTYEKIMKQEIESIYILELSPKYSKQLTEFIDDLPDMRVPIKFKRTGKGNKTKYHFSVA